MSINSTCSRYVCCKGWSLPVPPLPPSPLFVPYPMAAREWDGVQWGTFACAVLWAVSPENGKELRAVTPHLRYSVFEAVLRLRRT